MALQGTLQDFGALETFQLIALQHKTGTLEIAEGGQQRFFVFENGLMLAAHEDPLKAEDPLVRFLVETGYLKSQEIPGWLGFPSSQPVNRVDLLLKLSNLDEATIVAAYDLFLQTALDEILSWGAGRFQFHSGRVGAPSQIVGPWKIEGVLMESMRRLDELADLQAAELPPGLIPKIAKPAAARQLTDPFTRALTRRIDGRRSVQEIAAASALAGYDLYQALRVLRDEGIVELAEWIPSGPWMDALWRQRSRLRSFLFGASVPTLLLLLTLGIHAFLARHPSSWSSTPGHGFVTADGTLARDEFAVAQLMEVYRLRRGEYPPDFTALVEAQLLAPRTAKRMEREGVRWHRLADGDTYRWIAPIREAGP